MTVKDYMKMPYTRLVQEMNDESGHYYYGRILELESALPIPLPNKVSDYSGKFVIRLPKTLHQRLSIEAEQEGVSLNQWALYKLSSSVL